MPRTSRGDDKVAPAGHERSGRKRLARTMQALEKARAKRDKAQARVEALEALADELASRVAADAATTSAERGAEVADAAEQAAAKPKVAAKPKAADED